MLGFKSKAKVSKEESAAKRTELAELFNEIRAQEFRMPSPSGDRAGIRADPVTSILTRAKRTTDRDGKGARWNWAEELASMSDALVVEHLEKARLYRDEINLKFKVREDSIAQDAAEKFIHDIAAWTKSVESLAERPHDFSIIQMFEGLSRLERTRRQAHRVSSVELTQASREFDSIKEQFCKLVETSLRTRFAAELILNQLAEDAQFNDLEGLRSAAELAASQEVLVHLPGGAAAARQMMSWMPDLNDLAQRAFTVDATKNLMRIPFAFLPQGWGRVSDVVPILNASEAEIETAATLYGGGAYDTLTKALEAARALND